VDGTILWVDRLILSRRVSLTPLTLCLKDIFFKKQKKSSENPLHYPKYIKCKIKDNTKKIGRKST
jgi:hypothetical protein